MRAVLSVWLLALYATFTPAVRAAEGDATGADLLEQMTAVAKKLSDTAPFLEKVAAADAGLAKISGFDREKYRAVLEATIPVSAKNAVVYFCALKKTGLSADPALNRKILGILWAYFHWDPGVDRILLGQFDAEALKKLALENKSFLHGIYEKRCNLLRNGDGSQLDKIISDLVLMVKLEDGTTDQTALIDARMKWVLRSHEMPHIREALQKILAVAECDDFERTMVLMKLTGCQILPNNERRERLLALIEKNEERLRADVSLLSFTANCLQFAYDHKEKTRWDYRLAMKDDAFFEKKGAAVRLIITLGQQNFREERAKLIDRTLVIGKLDSLELQQILDDRNMTDELRGRIIDKMLAHETDAASPVAQIFGIKESDREKSYVLYRAGLRAFSRHENNPEQGMRIMMRILMSEPGNRDAFGALMKGLSDKKADLFVDSERRQLDAAKVLLVARIDEFARRLIAAGQCDRAVELVKKGVSLDPENRTFAALLQLAAERRPAPEQTGKRRAADDALAIVAADRAAVENLKALLSGENVPKQSLVDFINGARPKNDTLWRHRRRPATVVYFEVVRWAITVYAFEFDERVKRTYFPRYPELVDSDKYSYVPKDERRGFVLREFDKAAGVYLKMIDTKNEELPEIAGYIKRQSRYPASELADREFGLKTENWRILKREE